jgi:hypothetical protein
MTKTELKSIILELCEEDYYGVWELYWSYQNLPATKDIDDELFVAAIKDLVRETKIVAYNKDKYTETFDQVDLDVQLLRAELKEVRAGRLTEDTYWFAVPTPA